MGSDVLLQPSTLQADNHKKRTGFGPQQASFGVYVSNAFGGMSGALKVAADGRLAIFTVIQLSRGRIHLTIRDFVHHLSSTARLGPDA